MIDLNKVVFGPIVHAELSPELIGRIRLVRAALLGVDPHSMDYWVDGFRRDSHPSREVAFWEHLSAVWLEYLAMGSDERTEEVDKIAFRALYTRALSGSKERMLATSAGLSNDLLEMIENLYSKERHVYDLIDAFPGDKDELAGSSREYPEGLDKERFPEDLPELLIRELMDLDDAERLVPRA